MVVQCLYTTLKLLLDLSLILWQAKDLSSFALQVQFSTDLYIYSLLNYLRIVQI